LIKLALNLKAIGGCAVVEHSTRNLRARVRMLAFG
jgi:hypothetical protein